MCFSVGGLIEPACGVERQLIVGASRVDYFAWAWKIGCRAMCILNALVGRLILSLSITKLGDFAIFIWCRVVCAPLCGFII
jgi:hypothetical protein